MSVNSVSEQCSRAFVAKSPLLGSGSAVHHQKRSAIRANVSGYVSDRRVGCRAIEAAYKAGGHFGRKAPGVAFDVADVRTIDLHGPHAVERTARGQPALKRCEPQSDTDRRCCEDPTAA